MNSHFPWKDRILTLIGDSLFFFFFAEFLEISLKMIMGAEGFGTKSAISRTYANMGLEEYDKGHPKILSILASVLERTVQKNEKAMKGSKERGVVTVFHGTRSPVLTVQQYIERIFKYSNCSPSCFVVAYVYLERFLNLTDCLLTSLNVHRILITSIVLAVKFVDDDCYNNAYYAKVGGITTAELNKLEMKFLAALDFRLHVSVESFDKYCLQLEKEDNVKLQIDRPIRIFAWGKGMINKDIVSNCSPTVGGYTCRAF
ncbi:cyclin-P3-1-like isoform X3 [Nicotiana sylvestris]|uniref:Cyclin-P3-1-like isoform X3 n=1 Tax=Nicotiana sylvestris TaxID=4096 RepID=A0A1U7VD27_NICSY|nr:PREDICTED: cyclin-P3-1-like isoform X3 [Nicotiana sylvestris]